MNTKSYVISSIAASIWVFGFGFLIYGLFFPEYMAAAVPAAMNVGEADQSIISIAIGSVIQAFGLGLLYTKGHEGKGTMEGVRFGFYVGIFMIGIYYLMAGAYAYTMRGAMTVAMVDMVMYVGAGVVFALLYKD